RHAIGSRRSEQRFRMRLGFCVAGGKRGNGREEWSGTPKRTAHACYYFRNENNENRSNSKKLAQPHSGGKVNGSSIRVVPPFLRLLCLAYIYQGLSHSSELRWQ